MVAQRLMVGRDRELAQVLAALGRTRTSGDLILLSGEAGIGKTTLAVETVAFARDEGRRILEGRATHSDAPIPLGVFRDALRNHRRAVRETPPMTDELAAAFTGHLLPELGEARRPELDERDVLFEAAARYVGQLAAPDGLVILLEDLHWADPTTHDLVLHLARVSGAVPVLIVATCRSDGVSVDTSLDRFRLDRRRERLGEELHLAPVDAEAAGLLVRRVAPDLDVTVATEIHRLAQGNPFVIEELARDAAGGAAIAGGEVPWSVRQMLLGRIDWIAPVDRELLDWAAVGGEDFDLTLLQDVSGYDDDAFLTSLDRLRKAAMIEDDQCSMERMCFRHTLARDAVLHELIAPDRRRRYRRWLDLAGAATDSERAKSLESLVGYAVGAGDRRAAFDYSVAAARRSLALGGYRESDDHYERALDLWVPDVGEAARAQVFFELGRSLSPSRHAECALDSLNEARGLFAKLGDRVSAAVTLATSAAVRRGLGKGHEALVDLRLAADELGPDAPVLARLQVAAELARVLMICGLSDESSLVATEALALVPDQATRDQTLVAVQLWISLGGVPSRDGEQDRLALHRGLELARAIGDHVGMIRALTNLEDRSRWQHGMHDEAHVFREEGIEIARRYGLQLAEASLHDAEAEARAEVGDLQAARDALDRCERLVARVAPEHESVVNVRVRRAILQLVAGEIDAAERDLSEVWPQVRAARHFEISLTTAASIALGRFALGDTAGAAQMLDDEMLPMIESTRSDLVWYALIVAFGLAAALGRRDLAERIPQPVMRWAGGTEGLLVEALRELARDVVPSEQSVETGAAALAAAGFPWRAATIRFLAASALVRVSPGDEAAALARAADSWFARIGSHGWSVAARGLLRRLGRRAPSPRAAGGGELTAREREVLRLVADGATNREIAARLVISPPTAARHVANIFVKLGVGSRAEAVKVASEREMLGHPAST